MLHIYALNMVVVEGAPEVVVSERRSRLIES